MHRVKLGIHSRIDLAFAALAVTGILLVIAASLGCSVKSPTSPPRPCCPGGKCDRKIASSAYCRCTSEKGFCDCANCQCCLRQAGDARDVPFRTYSLAEVPAMNLPLSARQKNWGGGSCVHASTVMCLRWQGLDDLADWWRRTYSGGEHASGLSGKLDRAGVRFAVTTSGDVAFLEWACRTRRGCGITYYPNHFICLVHLDAEKAMLLDNNRIGQFITVPRAEFIRRWKGYGGWGCVPVYSPAPPIAFRAG